MQQSPVQAINRTQKSAQTLLKPQQVHDLVLHRRRLIEIPYTATLFDTVNALLANNVMDIFIVALPGRCISAGGSVIFESEKMTGAVRKQYIGMVTVLDVPVNVEDLGEKVGRRK